MRYNYSVRTKIRELREKGSSLGEIHEQTNVPKTTIRSWIKDIKLSETQTVRLKNRVQTALQQGRIKKQASDKELRVKNEKLLNEKGIKAVDKLSNRELLIAGVALYWAEGFKNKHEHRLGFCNSDPEMIKFYIRWLKDSLGVDKKDLIVRLTLNESYKHKASELENFWSEITGVPHHQFTKTFYQKTKWKKQFNSDNYHGVLRVHVKNSLNNLLLMKGWIQGLKLNLDSVD